MSTFIQQYQFSHDTSYVIYYIEHYIELEKYTTVCVIRINRVIY